MPFSSLIPAYDALVINISPCSTLALFARIIDNVLARLPIRELRYHESFWIHPKLGIQYYPPDPTNHLKNGAHQALILYNLRSEFVVIEFTDGSGCTIEALRHPKFRGAMPMQYDMVLQWQQSMNSPIPESVFKKVVPGFWSRNDYEGVTMSNPTSRYTQSGFTPTPPYNGTIDKLFFAGYINNQQERQVLTVLEHHPDFMFVRNQTSADGIHFNPVKKKDLYHYYANHRGSLGLRGTSGFCFREFDILNGAVPLFMHPFTYSSQMEPLVDNEHYFAIEYDPTPEIFAQRIMDRFVQVRGDAALLEKVRVNGQQWFSRNCEIPHIADHTAHWVLNTLPYGAQPNYGD